MPANSTASTSISSDHCDVIVIGAGLSSLTTAAFLAQAGARVVFFDGSLTAVLTGKLATENVINHLIKSGNNR